LGMRRAPPDLTRSKDPMHVIDLIDMPYAGDLMDATHSMNLLDAVGITALRLA